MFSILNKKDNLLELFYKYEISKQTNININKIKLDMFCSYTKDMIVVYYNYRKNIFKKESEFSYIRLDNYDKFIRKIKLEKLNEK